MSVAAVLGAVFSLSGVAISFLKLRSDESASIREEKRKLASDLLVRMPQFFEQFEKIRMSELSISEEVERDNRVSPLRSDFPIEWLFFLRGFEKIKGDFKFLNEKKYDYKARINEAYEEYEQLINLVNELENYLTACEEADIPIHNPTFEKRIHRDGKEDDHSLLIKKNVGRITKTLTRILN